MALGIIGIVVALAIFLYGAYKNVSVLYLAPLCGVIVAVTNGLNANDASHLCMLVPLNKMQQPAHGKSAVSAE